MWSLQSENDDSFLPLIFLSREATVHQSFVSAKFHSLNLPAAPGYNLT